MNREEVIEEAAKAIYEAQVEESTCGDLARAALAVFEKAHTPTDDERVNAAAMEIYEWSNTISKSGALMLARAALRAAGETGR